MVRLFSKILVLLKKNVFLNYLKLINFKFKKNKKKKLKKIKYLYHLFNVLMIKKKLKKILNGINQQKIFFLKILLIIIKVEINWISLIHMINL